jgi:hypothetical protein
MKKKFSTIIPPDRPSPIPAWQQYYISKDAEDKILKELEAHHEDRLLVGLSVGYLFIPNEKPEGEEDNKFFMTHGYLVGCDDEEIVEKTPENASTPDQTQQPVEGEETGGLGDEFISELYQDVRQLVLENAPEGSGKYLVSLEVTTAHFSKPKLKCEGRKCGICAAHNKKHILKKRKKNENECTWVCTGSACED